MSYYYFLFGGSMYIIDYTLTNNFRLSSVTLDNNGVDLVVTDKELLGFIRDQVEINRDLITGRRATVDDLMDMARMFKDEIEL
jgi:tRNA A-37 threonylcarbamoyl transferase component Bud32